MDENALVVKRGLLNDWLTDVFSTKDLDRLQALILANHEFLPRSKAEFDPSYKQIIPYIVVRHQSEYLIYERSKKQDESRLHLKKSLGFGGHIHDREAAGPDNVIITAMKRELSEEVTIRGKYTVELVGTINDDSNEVGAVHFGLVFLLTTDSPDFEVNEMDQISAGWITKEEAQIVYDRLESWSQLVYTHLISA